MRSESDFASGDPRGIDFMGDGDGAVVSGHREIACADVMINDDIAISRSEVSRLIESARVQRPVDGC